MNTLSRVERTLTELDHARLRRLVGEHHDEMEELLDGSDVVESREIASDVVTMNSQVLLADSTTGEQYNLTLCYPQDAEPAAGFVSVLSPVGGSLLGERIGASVQWKTPGGQGGQAQIVGLLFQPESSGDFLT